MQDKWTSIFLFRIIDETTKEAAAVDPAEPHKIFLAAQENGADLKLVLTTHHHWSALSTPFELLIYIR